MQPDPNPKITQAEMRAAIEEQVLREKTKYAPNAPPPPLHAAQTKVAGRLHTQPSEPEYLLERLLLHKMVAAVVAAGGKGKTFFFMQLAVSMAAGKPLGPIRPVRPLNVLGLFAEDPSEVVDARLWAISEGQFPEGLHVASIVGQVGPLMYLDNGRPTRSEWFDWLRQTIESHPGLDVLILDPKSRLYGLNENDNDHATQWVACLEALAQEFGIAIIFSHHVSKAHAESLNQAMSRGASALVDGCRLVLGLAEMSAPTAKRYGITNPRGYVELDVVKSNYTPGLPASVIFSRKQTGVLEYAPLEGDRVGALVSDLLRLLGEHEAAGKVYTRRRLVFDSEAKDLAEAMKEAAKGRGQPFTRSGDIPLAIDQAIRDRLLEEVVDTRPGPGARGRVLRVVSPPADL